MKALKFTIPVWLYLAFLCLVWAKATPLYFLLLIAMSRLKPRLGEFSETELRQELKFFYGNKLMQRVKIAGAICLVMFSAVLFYLVYVQTPRGWNFAILVLATAYNNGSFLLPLAHDFSHAHSAGKRRLGDLLLIILGLPFFHVDHIYGHHEQVGTSRDKGSARLNQSFYEFLINSFPQRIKRSYSPDSDLPRAVKTRLLRANYLFTGLLAVFGAGLYVIQPLLLWFWLGQVIGGYVIYELTNYVQHYGLRRLPGEAVGIGHSWNSYFKYPNYVAWFLMVHSPHHVEQPLHKIRSLFGPRLPYSPYQMLLLALYPPLWFRVMNPLVAKSRGHAINNQDIPRTPVAGIPLTKNYDIYDTSV